MSQGAAKTAVQNGSASGPTPSAAGLLQRRCACGNHAAGGQCAACAERDAVLRRSSADAAAAEVPPSVHDTLRSSGQPLDAAVQTFMAERFGHDFSRVRVHTDARAAESAARVNALAYTVGQDLVFAQGRYAPDTSQGMRLLAHELAHSVQQGGAGAVPQAKLEIGSAEGPLENAADRAADAVMRGGLVPPLGGTGPRLSRQVAETRSLPEQRGECRPNPIFGTDITHYTPPTAEAPTGKYTITSVQSVSNNEKRVRISTGKSYLVRRVPWTTTEDVPALTGGVKPGLSRQDVWLDVELCKGDTKGTIRVGANVPDQVVQFMLNNITSGGDASAAWRKASITPTVSGSLKIGHWSVDLSAHTTVSSQGKDTGVGGEVSVSTDVAGGRATVGASGESQKVGQDPFGGAKGQVFFRFEWGKSQTPPKCTKQRVRSGFTYECREEREVSKPGTQTVTRSDERVYNLFFHYAVPTFDEPRNRRSWTDLTADLATGTYQVSRIEGWASPEGPTGPGAGGFKGNKELSQRRADAVKARITKLCKGGGCFAASAEVIGLGERLAPGDEQGVPSDISGRPLEEHVTEAFPTDPGEATVRTPALMKELARTRSMHARSERIYVELRRAIVTLRRSATETDKCSFKVQEEAYLSDCPDDIRKSAFPDQQA